MQTTLSEQITAISFFIMLIFITAAAIKYLFPPKKKSTEFDKLLEKVLPLFERLFPKSREQAGNLDIREYQANILIGFIVHLQSITASHPFPIDAMIQEANSFLWKNEILFAIVENKQTGDLELKEI